MIENLYMIGGRTGVSSQSGNVYTTFTLSGKNKNKLLIAIFDEVEKYFPENNKLFLRSLELSKQDKTYTISLRATI